MDIRMEFSGTRPELLPDLYVKIEEARYTLPAHWQEHLKDVTVIITDLSSEERKAIRERAEIKKIIWFENCGTNQAISKMVEGCGGLLLYYWIKMFLREHPSFSEVIKKEAGSVATHLRVQVDWGNENIIDDPDPNQLFCAGFPLYYLNTNCLDPEQRAFFDRIDWLVRSKYVM